MPPDLWVSPSGSHGTLVAGSTTSATSAGAALPTPSPPGLPACVPCGPPTCPVLPWAAALAPGTCSRHPPPHHRHTLGAGVGGTSCEPGLRLGCSLTCPWGPRQPPWKGAEWDGVPRASGGLARAQQVWRLRPDHDPGGGCGVRLHQGHREPRRPPKGGSFSRRGALRARVDRLLARSCPEGPRRGSLVPAAVRGPAGGPQGGAGCASQKHRIQSARGPGL